MRICLEVFIFAIMLGGCWAFGTVVDGWKSHDEVRRKHGVTNSWTPVRGSQ